MNPEPRIDPPSGYRIEIAMSTWAAARSALLRDDPELAEDEAALSRLLGNEEGDIDSILARLLRGVRHAEVMANGAKAQIEDIKARQDRYRRRAEAMRGTAFAIMTEIQRFRVELPDLTATIRAGVPGLVLSEDAVLADEYVRVTRTPDRAAIISDLKQGVVIEGAQLSNGIPALAIKAR